MTDPRPYSPARDAQVSQNPATRRLADHVNNRAAAYIGQVRLEQPCRTCLFHPSAHQWCHTSRSCPPLPQVLLRPSTALYPAAPGESQMAINTLRAGEACLQLLLVRVGCTQALCHSAWPASALAPHQQLHPPTCTRHPRRTRLAAELLSDDSNFRAGLIPLLAPTAAHLLASGG